MMDNIKSLLVKFFGTIGNKASHYMYTYLLVTIVLGLIILFNQQSTGYSGDFWGQSLNLLIVPILFPAGLGAILTKLWEMFGRNPADFIEMLITGWLAYFTIILFAKFIKNIRTGKIWYFIFIFLIVLNFYGCANTNWGI